MEQCLGSCIGGLDKLQKKLHKLQTHHVPSGVGQKAWTEIQRLCYPFKESTLVKLREIVSELRQHLSLAVQVLDLDLGTESHKAVVQIAVDVKDTANNVRAILTIQQADQFRKIVDRLSPPDPWTNHNAHRRSHEANTGSWLLQSEQYRRWKTGPSRHLWLYGKAGCGKSVLCSTVIEDVRAHCSSSISSGFAAFYFTFSDNQKQTYGSLLRSLIAQLAWREPALSILRQMCENPHASVPGADELEGSC